MRKIASRHLELAQDRIPTRHEVNISAIEPRARQPSHHSIEVFVGVENAHDLTNPHGLDRLFFSCVFVRHFRLLFPRRSKTIVRVSPFAALMPVSLAKHAENDAGQGAWEPSCHNQGDFGPGRPGPARARTFHDPLGKFRR
ncbi:MAG TPA: hypothetical protein VGC74_07395 [Stenotrophomonas sp.]